jgi:hypothetical protein
VISWPRASGLAGTLARSLALDGPGRLLDAGCGPETVTLPDQRIIERTADDITAGHHGI